MEPFVALTTVPDEGTAAMIEEALEAAGAGPVEIEGRSGVAYLPRATTIEYEVRVLGSKLTHARAILERLEEESGQAALGQAADSLSSQDPREDPSTPASPRRRWVFWVALLAALILALPILLSALTVAAHFFRELVAGH